MPEFGPRPERVSYDRAGDSPEGDSIAAELRPKGVIAQCILGNGKCPQTCELYQQALGLTEELGETVMRSESRTQVIFRADTQKLVAILTKCELEPRKL